MQSNKKVNNGGDHEDRNEQFGYINNVATDFVASKYPVISLEVIVKLIVGTTTSTGLIIKSKLDEGLYEKGIKITDEELSKINIKQNSFHGEWN